MPRISTQAGHGWLLTREAGGTVSGILLKSLRWGGYNNNKKNHLRVNDAGILETSGAGISILFRPFAKSPVSFL